LNEFLEWLENQSEYKNGVIFIYHDQRKFVSFISLAQEIHQFLRLLIRTTNQKLESENPHNKNQDQQHQASHLQNRHDRNRQRQDEEFEGNALIRANC
jgi:hypothetical protein